jgi:hypothetical protein
MPGGKKVVSDDGGVGKIVDGYPPKFGGVTVHDNRTWPEADGADAQSMGR